MRECGKCHHHFMLGVDVLCQTRRGHFSSLMDVGGNGERGGEKADRHTDGDNVSFWAEIH